MAMPSFVPSLRFDVTTNWEKLDKPGKVKYGYESMIAQGARIRQLQLLATQVSDQQCYRAEDFTLLTSRVEQLEKMLPLQTHHLRVPYQYDFAGSEMFDTGNVHLRPVLTGYYGLH